MSTWNLPPGCTTNDIERAQEQLCEWCEHPESAHAPFDADVQGDPLEYVPCKRPCSLCDCENLMMEEA